MHCHFYILNTEFVDIDKQNRTQFDLSFESNRAPCRVQPLMRIMHSAIPMRHINCYMISALFCPRFDVLCVQWYTRDAK